MSNGHFIPFSFRSFLLGSVLILFWFCFYFETASIERAKRVCKASHSDWNVIRILNERVAHYHALFICVCDLLGLIWLSTAMYLLTVLQYSKLNFFDRFERKHKGKHTASQKDEMYFTVLYCTALNWNVLNCTELYWIVLNCTELYTCTVDFGNVGEWTSRASRRFHRHAKSNDNSCENNRATFVLTSRWRTQRWLGQRGTRCCEPRAAS